MPIKRVDSNTYTLYTVNKGGEIMANTSTKLVYVNEELHLKLKVLSAQKGITIGKLIEIAINMLEGEK